MLIRKFIKKLDNFMAMPWVKSVKVGLISMALTLGVVHSAYAIPDQKPLFQSNSVKPIMMLNMSKDHQMFFKVYDDYSDITNPTGGAADGKPDTTYVPKYEYYGYFDGKKCYTYNVTDNRFNPNSTADADHYCNTAPNTGEWSGNFLNWATMTRVDAIRKILYGGYRSTDTTSLTVLERTLLTPDAHSFAKFYDGNNSDGNNIAKLTPFTVPQHVADSAATGITICNTTDDTDAANSMSHLINSPPLIRVVRGNYSLWASNEGRQCQFNGADNYNVAVSQDRDHPEEGSGIRAYANAPTANDANKLGAGLNAGEYVVRVSVCVANKEEDNCKLYTQANAVKKPKGLFQEFGETKKIDFGLMTGSYGRNKSGGALRKTIGDMSSEISAATGVFTGVDGAIKVLNSLHIYGYDYSNGNYDSGNTGSDGCPGGISGFANGKCSNWGNPQSEIYLESLRYLVSKTTVTANPNFAVDDTARVAAFKTVAWGNASATPTVPVTNDNWCAPLNVLQFNSSSSSFDNDELGGATDLGLANNADLLTWINKLGNSAHENLSGSYFAGFKAGGAEANDQDGLCSGKTFSLLSDFTGLCPDAPRLKGGYGLAGLAYYARQNDLNTSVTGKQTVRTYGVAMAPAVPSIKIPVPGLSGKSIQILPACKSNRTSTTVDGVANQAAVREGNCAIADFKIVSTDISDTNVTNKAKLYVNWEVAEQGNDYDQDLWGTLDIEVTRGNVRVTSQLFAISTGAEVGFGYVISGTTQDGFKVHSGNKNFIGGSYCTVAGRCTCNAANAFGSCPLSLAIPQDYTVNTGDTASATFLPTPLALAAKWGGYSDKFEKAAKKESDRDYAALPAAQAAETNATDYAKNYLISKIKSRDVSDSYYYVTDPRALEIALTKAFNDIAAGIGSASSVATVSARVSEGSLVYQAQFNSEDWSGALYGFQFDASGNLDDIPELCTSNVVRSGNTICTGGMQTNATNRNVYTNSATGSLISLAWDNLTGTQKSALQLITESTTDNAQKRVDWLLGNETYETSQTNGFLRARGSGTSRIILGDTVNSTPVYVGNKNFRYNNLSGTAGTTYRAFVESKSSKPKLIVVGSNDGMVHAFAADTLREKFAFIPNSVFSKLTTISSSNYSDANLHTYAVDGPITYSDVYINNSWRRVVVGTLGAGGRGIYALDVTDETPTLLFELTETDYPQIGYIMGKPIIVPMKNGRWAAIMGNGDSSGQNSTLLVIDLESPRDTNYTKIISTGSGTGLSAPAVDIASDGTATYVYAGDINGNLWKFNVNSTSAGSWGLSYKLFAAGATKPIVAAPTLGINASKNWETMVYVGTGKYYDTGDKTSVDVQTFYAIADVGSTVAVTTLMEKTFATNSSAGRTLNTGNPTWLTQNGWYLNFPSTAFSGERITTKALLLYDKLIFPTLIPSSHKCDHGGSSWLMEVDAVGDKYVGQHLLPSNVYNNFLVLGNINYALNKADGSNGTVIESGSDGSLPAVDTNTPTQAEGRESWRQVQ